MVRVIFIRGLLAGPDTPGDHRKSGRQPRALVKL
jgi:hypothetical protein